MFKLRRNGESCCSIGGKSGKLCRESVDCLLVRFIGISSLLFLLHHNTSDPVDDSTIVCCKSCFILR